MQELLALVAKQTVRFRTFIGTVVVVFLLVTLWRDFPELGLTEDILCSIVPQLALCQSPIVGKE